MSCHPSFLSRVAALHFQTRLYLVNMEFLLIHSVKRQVPDFVRFCQAIFQDACMGSSQDEQLYLWSMITPVEDIQKGLSMCDW